VRITPELIKRGSRAGEPFAIAGRIVFIYMKYDRQ